MAKYPLKVVSVQDSDVGESHEQLLLEIKKQDYVCSLYNMVWIGFVEDRSDEHGDYYIHFMHPYGPARMAPH